MTAPEPTLDDLPLRVDQRLGGRARPPSACIVIPTATR